MPCLDQNDVIRWRGDILIRLEKIKVGMKTFGKEEHAYAVVLELYENCILQQIKPRLSQATEISDMLT